MFPILTLSLGSFMMAAVLRLRDNNFWLLYFICGTVGSVVAGIIK